MTAILTLAAIGLILNVVGRWVMVRESPGLSRLWRCALALLPGAELVFMVQRGERTRSGSILCALSIALMLPLASQLAFVLRDAGCTPGALFFDARARELVFGEGGRLRDFGRTERRDHAIARKEAKLRELSDYLLRWHLLLAERRDMICDTNGDETRRFNEDVIAYHHLLAAARIELAEWKGLAKGRGSFVLDAGAELIP